MNDIARRVGGAAAVLVHADSHDLPEPTKVTVDEHIVIAVDNLDDLTVWAMLLEEPIASHRDTGDHRLMRHQVRGELLEVPVTVWTHSVIEAFAEAVTAR